jgi:hypothetical protein
VSNAVAGPFRCDIRTSDRSLAKPKCSELSHSQLRIPSAFLTWRVWRTAETLWNGMPHKHDTIRQIAEHAEGPVI